MPEAARRLSACEIVCMQNSRLRAHLLVARVELSALRIEEVEQQGAQDCEARLADGAVAFAGELGPALERFRCGNDSRAVVPVDRAAEFSVQAALAPRARVRLLLRRDGRRNRRKVLK